MQLQYGSSAFQLSSAFAVKKKMAKQFEVIIWLQGKNILSADTNRKDFLKEGSGWDWIGHSCRNSGVAGKAQFLGLNGDYKDVHFIIIH